MSVTSLHVSPRVFLVTAIALAVAGVLLALGALWWWALFGMSSNVATAYGWTSGALVFSGFMAGTGAIR